MGVAKTHLKKSLCKNVIENVHCTSTFESECDEDGKYE